RAATMATPYAKSATNATLMLLALSRPVQISVSGCGGGAVGREGGGAASAAPQRLQNALPSATGWPHLEQFMAPRILPAADPLRNASAAGLKATQSGIDFLPREPSFPAIDEPFRRSAAFHGDAHEPHPRLRSLASRVRLDRRRREGRLFSGAHGR